MSCRHHLHHIYDVYTGEVDVNWNQDRGSILIVITLTILTGFLLPSACWMQHWCAASVWDHEDRWQGTKQFAITLLFIIYVPLLLILVYFHIPIVHRLYFSPTHAWFNLLVFAWYVGIWWIVILPLAPTLALVLEWIDPRTRNPERVLLPWEQPLPLQPPAHTKGAKSGRKKAATKISGATPQKRNKGRAQPIGELLLEEKVEREQQTQVDHQQLPLSASQGLTPLAESSAPTSPPSSEPISPKNSDKGKRESLKELF
jgi:hypothetical protein